MFCIFVLRCALKMTSRMKNLIAVFFNQCHLTHLSNIEYASLFIKHNVNITTYRLPAQNASNAEVNVSARL